MPSTPHSANVLNSTWRPSPTRCIQRASRASVLDVDCHVASAEKTLLRVLWAGRASARHVVDPALPRRRFPLRPPAPTQRLSAPSPPAPRSGQASEKRRPRPLSPPVTITTPSASACGDRALDPCPLRKNGHNDLPKRVSDDSSSSSRTAGFPCTACSRAVPECKMVLTDSRILSAGSHKQELTSTAAQRWP